MDNETGRSQEAKPLGEMKNEIRRLMEANNLNACFECGKCSAVCPMIDFYADYSYDCCARSVVERLTFSPETIDEEALWFCLACKECTFYCPSGVDFQNFMIRLRELLVRHGHTRYGHFCPECGAYLMPKKQLQGLKEQMNGNGGNHVDLLLECPTCKRNKYGATLHALAAKPRFFHNGRRD